MTRSSGDAQTWGLFLLLSLIWGSSYLFIKIGLDEGVAALTLVSIRTLLGTALLGAVLWFSRDRMPRSLESWRHLSVVGMTNIVIPYVLITWGEQSISSGMAGILTALAPLFTVVIASLVLRDEPATVARLAGLVVGFTGVALLAAPSLSVSGSEDDGLLSVIAMVGVAGAAFSYAIAAVYTRHRLSGRPLVREPDGNLRAHTSLEISFGQVFIGMIVITIIAVIFERPDGGLLALPQSTTAIASLLALGLLGTGVAYLLYFALIRRWGATRATLIAYVMPIVAIVLGFLVLDERLRPIELVGAALIIGGVVLANSSYGQRLLFGRTRAA